MRQKLVLCLLGALGFSAGADDDRNAPSIIQVYSIPHKVYLKSFPYLGQYSVICDSSKESTCQGSCNSIFHKNGVPTIMYKNELEIQLMSIEEGCVFDVIYQFDNVRAKSSSNSLLSHSVGVDLAEIQGFTEPAELAYLNVTLMMDMRSSHSQSEIDDHQNPKKNQDTVNPNDIFIPHGNRPHHGDTYNLVGDHSQTATTKGWSVSLVQSYSSSSGACVGYSAYTAGNQISGEVLHGDLSDFESLPAFATNDYDSTWLPITYDPSKLHFNIFENTDDKKKIHASNLRRLAPPTKDPKPKVEHNNKNPAGKVHSDLPPPSVTVPATFRLVHPMRVSLSGLDGGTLSDYMSRVSGSSYSQSLLCISIVAFHVPGQLATAILSGGLNAYKIRSGKGAELYHRSVLEMSSCEECKRAGGFWCPSGESFPLNHKYFSPKVDKTAENSLQISPSSKCMTNPSFCPSAIESCDGNHETIPGYVIKEV